jgi:RNA polymerase sigma-70 factor (ECF subfamily)
LIKAFAIRLSSGTKSENLAEELVQETMLKVWQKAGSFNSEKANASTWIFTIARNTRIDLLRKKARHQNNRVANDHSEEGFDVEDIWIEDENEDVFNQIAKQRSIKSLHETLQELPEEQSFILKKVYLEDKSHSEIAQELDLPLGTVKSRVRLALNKLRLTVDRF